MEEVKKLLEEKEMDLDALLQRLVEEGQQFEADEVDDDDEEENDDGADAKKLSPEKVKELMAIDEYAIPKTRHVSFAASHQERTFDPSPLATFESILAEDDHKEMDEFHPDNEELDDEMTIDAEERLGRDMSYKDEIELLKRENEMSIEELRAMYSNMEEVDNNDSGVWVCYVLVDRITRYCSLCWFSARCCKRDIKAQAYLVHSIGISG